jgi:hypothetical protein
MKIRFDKRLLHRYTNIEYILMIFLQKNGAAVVKSVFHSTLPVNRNFRLESQVCLQAN